MWCKARPDWLTDEPRTIVHFKTTSHSANPESFSAHMVDMGYDVAGAFYARGGTKVFGIEPSRILTVFLVQETEQPYACALISLAPCLMEIATLKVEQAIHDWAKARAADFWPAYPTRICYAEARPWQITQAAEQALAREDYESYERITEVSGGAT